MVRQLSPFRFSRRAKLTFSSLFSQPFPLPLPPFSLPFPQTRPTLPSAALRSSPLQLPSPLQSLPLPPVTLLVREAGSRTATLPPSPTFSNPAVVPLLRRTRRARLWTSSAPSPTRRKRATLSLFPFLLRRPLATSVATTSLSDWEAAQDVASGARMSRDSRRRRKS
jgi:hypothetical protein